MKEISAGGVVYRKAGDDLQVQMIQDRYGKITLPKGKMEPGETVEQTALREILEETGIVGRIVKPLETITYQSICQASGSWIKRCTTIWSRRPGGRCKRRWRKFAALSGCIPSKRGISRRIRVTATTIRY